MKITGEEETLFYALKAGPLPVPEEVWRRFHIEMNRSGAWQSTVTVDFTGYPELYEQVTLELITRKLES